MITIITLSLYIIIDAIRGGFEKRGVKVASLHFAWFYFCILTAGFKAHRIPNSS